MSTFLDSINKPLPSSIRYMSIIGHDHNNVLFAPLTLPEFHVGQGDDFASILCALNPHCLKITVKSPVDVEVIAPDGRMMSAQVAAIPGASCTAVQDEDGHTTTTVLVPFPLAGDYHINVTPKPGAAPTDTYTLEVIRDGIIKLMVQNEQIQNIPPQGKDYMVPVPPRPNEAPIAYAGQDQTECIGLPGTLNGNGSFDPDNGPQSLHFAWTQMSGPATLTLTGTTTATPTFTPTVAGTYTFKLIVNDGQADSAPDTVDVSVGSCTTFLSASILPSSRSV